jgi:hypothetical protein
VNTTTRDLQTCTSCDRAAFGVGGAAGGSSEGTLAVQRLIREECVQLASVRDRRMVPISTLMHDPRPERGLPVRSL